RGSRSKRQRWFAAALAFVVLGAAVAVALSMTLSRHGRQASAAAKRTVAASQIGQVDQSAAKDNLSSEPSSSTVPASPSPTPAETSSPRSTSSSATACSPVYIARKESWPNCSNTGARGTLAARSGDLTIK